MIQSKRIPYKTYADAYADLLDPCVRIWCECGNDFLHCGYEEDGAKCYWCDRSYHVEIKVIFKSLDVDQE